MEILSLMLLGTFVGLGSSLIGVGGGLLLVPLLPVILPLTQHQVIATSLLTILCVIVVNVFSFHRKKLIDWRIVLRIAPFSVMMSFSMAKFSMRLPGVYLKWILISFLIAFFLFVVLKKDPNNLREDSKNEGDFFSREKSKGADEKESSLVSPKGLHTALLGLLAGGISGITGLGSGLIVTPLLLKLRWTKNHSIAPTANGIMMFSASFATIAFHSGEQSGDILVKKEWIVALVASALMSSFIGRRYHKLVNRKWRKRILATLLLGFCCKEVVKLLFL